MSDLKTVAYRENWPDMHRYGLSSEDRVPPPNRDALVLRADAEALQERVRVLREALRQLDRAYVNLMENGRDRIRMLGGQCDSLDVMEVSDPNLRAARAVLEATQ